LDHPFSVLSVATAVGVELGGFEGSLDKASLVEIFHIFGVLSLLDLMLPVGF
jgi:hypothetical protein